MYPQREVQGVHNTLRPCVADAPPDAEPATSVQDWDHSDECPICQGKRLAGHDDLKPVRNY